MLPRFGNKAWRTTVAIAAFVVAAPVFVGAVVAFYAELRKDSLEATDYWMSRINGLRLGD